MKRLILAVMALTAMVSCTNEKKNLVLYYSQTGATKAVAEEISSLTGADIASLDVEEAYDGNFSETVARCLEEQKTGFVPTLKPLDVNIGDYEVIFIGYPVWFGTYAPPVEALLRNEKFAGKKVVPFCTFGSGGLNTSADNLKAVLPDAQVVEGYGVRNARLAAAPEEIRRFLARGGYIAGEVETVPDYSEQQSVTPEQRQIFDEACNSYQFPLGSPVTCGCRETSWGTEYLFNVISATSDGQTSESRIYVTVADGKAEFTQVER